MRELCTQFERATGNTIKLHFEVNADLKKKIEAGEAFDVAVLNPPVIDALIKDGKLVAGSRADIGRSGLGAGRAKGRAEARHLIGGSLQAHAAGGESRRLSRQGRERTLFRQSARSAGHQGRDARQAQADGGRRHGRSCRARGSRHGRGGGDAHHRRARRRSGRTDSGGPADQDRFCGRLERLREGTRCSAGADPLSHRARSRADAAGQTASIRSEQTFSGMPLPASGIGSMLVSLQCRWKWWRTYEKFRPSVRGLDARRRHYDCCFGANQMGHADAVSGRQFPHSQHHAVRSRRRQGDQRLPQNRDPLGWLADQACRNQTQRPPRNHADR